MFLPCFVRDLHTLGASQGVVWAGFRQDLGKIQEGNGFCYASINAEQVAYGRGVVVTGGYRSCPAMQCGDRDNRSHTPTSLFWCSDSSSFRACNGTEYAALCARNVSECTANPSRIGGNIDIRETFKVWEVGRTFLALSQGCTAEAPLYASMDSGDAAIDAFPWGAWPRDAAVTRTSKQAGKALRSQGHQLRSCHETKRFRILATLKQGNKGMYSNTSGYVHLGLRLDWGKGITGQ